MGWIILILMLGLAAVGILGAVIRFTLIIVLSVVLALLIFAAIGGWAFRAWLRDAGRRIAEGGTVEYRSSGRTYDVRGWVRKGDAPPPQLPEKRDPD